MFKKNLPYIIAEIASAHEGDINLAIEIAKHAITSKADAVKFQMFKSEELLSKNNPFFEEFRKIEFSFKNWEKIIRSIDNKKISLIAETYDEESLLFAKSLNVFSGYNQHRVPWLRIIDDGILGFGSVRDAPETKGTAVDTEHPIVVITSNV